MILIVGLGNPGGKYASTRHNLGFMVVDELARGLLPLEKTKWDFSRKFNAQLIVYKLSRDREQETIMIAKPETFMNASGFSVAKIAGFYKLKPDNIWVVHDDADLVLGRLRIRKGGASGGHHGVESVVEKLKTDKFVRFRLGIGRKGWGKSRAELDRYVMQEFTHREKLEIKHLIKKAADALRKAIKEGIEKAANCYSQ